MMKLIISLLILTKWLCALYVVNDSKGLGRIFDGIGGLSGGGATSKLLPNYPEKQRNEILDYLFIPNFGASLQILKVEIGGDAQSTDGTEASHMHTPWDENYQRGYEWWLMVEAKKRNPNIKLVGLPWAFPGWVNNGSSDPYTNPKVTATYVIKWILGAKKYYNLTIDYIGIWNTHSYNVEYIITLRNYLIMNNLQHVQIIAYDGPFQTTWDISQDILKNTTLRDSIAVIGAHYPGTKSTDDAVATGLKLWASEDFSTYNDNIGAGCWARILNQNYAVGNMTSTISWTLVAAYYDNLPLPRSGLMTAIEPWSGNYIVESPIWITAHTTQFTQIGWTYFKHQSGSGKLINGGSYVSLLSPDRQNFTMIIETMTHNHSICVRPRLAPYSVKSQEATFKLGGSLTRLKYLHVWYSKLGFAGEQTTLMKKLDDLVIHSNSFTLQLDIDTVYTLSTVNTARKGTFPNLPPKPQPLNLPYYDNFDNNLEYSEAYNFGPQIGSFEVVKSSNISRGMVNRQTVQQVPIYWCNSEITKPVTMGGNYNWSDVTVSIDASVPSVNGTDGVFLAARVSEGACSTNNAQGIFFWMYPGSQTYEITADIAQKEVLKKGCVTLSVDKWFTIDFTIVRNQVYLNINGTEYKIDLPSGSSPKGFIAYGTHNYGVADFDNFKVEQASTKYT